MAWRKLATALLFSGTAMTLSSCGGGDGSTTVPTSVVAVSPPPAVPPPPPPITPPPPSGIQLVGAAPGQTLQGLLACARDPVTRDGEGRVTGLPVLTGAKIDNSLLLLFRDTDSYSLDVNGFGGSDFAPADKRTSATLAFDQFLKAGGDEFLITRSNSLSGTRTFATHGLYNAAGLCFFAAGLPAAPLPTSGTGDYLVIVDGIAKSGDQTLRLLPSFEGSLLKVDYAERTANLTLVLAGRPNAFGDFTGQSPVSVTTATASLKFLQAGPAFTTTTLTGSGGYSGTVTGMLVGDTQNVSGSGGFGAVFTFEMKNAAGEVIFGTIVAERNLI
jgi:hypothetical protein